MLKPMDAELFKGSFFFVQYKYPLEFVYPVPSSNEVIIFSGLHVHKKPSNTPVSKSNDAYCFKFLCFLFIDRQVLVSRVWADDVYYESAVALNHPDDIAWFES